MKTDTTEDAVKEAMAGWPSPREARGFVAVPTHCIYPSNSVVRVYVSGGAQSFQVQDRSGAWDEFDSSGGHLWEAKSVIASAARPYGLSVDKMGAIYSKPIETDQLIGTIVLVANASRDAANALLSKFRPRPKKNFRNLLEELISQERVRGSFEVGYRRPISGVSNKPHKFDYEIRLPSAGRLLLDGVVPEASSVNAVLVANLDVQRAEIPGLIQRIVYDDTDRWRAADLAMLTLGAPVVPFSKLRPVLDRLLAA